MTPDAYSNDVGGVILFAVYRFLAQNTTIMEYDTWAYIRPVISISGTALNSGTGTKTDTFKIN